MVNRLSRPQWARNWQYFTKDYETEKQLIVKSALAVDPRLEPVLYTPAQFANKYDTLAAEVKRFGISLIK